MRPPGTALESELGHLRAVAVSSGAIEAYKSKRLGDGKAKATINRELACAGVPEQTAMRISGHRTSSVFRRYRIVETKDLLSALTQTDSTLKADPHKPAMFPHNGIDQPQKAAREPIRKIVILRKDIRHTKH